MANTAFNTIGTISTTSVTGSFAGFTVVSGSATFTGLKDYNNTNVSTSSIALWTNIPVGTTVPLYITSASLSSGAVVFYPISIEVPKQ
jgi:hypothetical protein